MAARAVQKRSTAWLLTSVASDASLMAYEFEGLGVSLTDVPDANGGTNARNASRIARCDQAEVTEQDRFARGSHKPRYAAAIKNKAVAIKKVQIEVEAHLPISQVFDLGDPREAPPRLILFRNAMLEFK